MFPCLRPAGLPLVGCRVASHLLTITYGQTSPAWAPPHSRPTPKAADRRPPTTALRSPEGHSIIIWRIFAWPSPTPRWSLSPPALLSRLFLPSFGAVSTSRRRLLESHSSLRQRAARQRPPPDGPRYLAQCASIASSLRPRPACVSEDSARRSARIRLRRVPPLRSFPHSTHKSLDSILLTL